MFIYILILSYLIIETNLTLFYEWSDNNFQTDVITVAYD